MRTVKSLIEELHRFPEDAVCLVLDADVIGLVIQAPPDDNRRSGFIHCGREDRKEFETELMTDRSPRAHGIVRP